MPTTIYGSSVASTIVTTSNTFDTGVSSSGSSANPVGTATGWLPLNIDNTGAIVATEPQVTGHFPSQKSFLWDATTLNLQLVNNATSWSAGIKLAMSTGSVTADIHVRLWVRTANGINWTQTGSDLLLSAQTINTTATTFTVTGALPVFVLGNGDRIYIDVIVNITANSSSAGSTLNHSFGGTNMPLTFPDYSPASYWRSSAGRVTNSIVNTTSFTLAPGVFYNWGDLAIVVVEFEGSMSLNTFSDSLGHTWHRGPDSSLTNNECVLFWTIITTSGTPTYTLVFSANITNVNQIVLAAIAYSASSPALVPQTQESSAISNTGQNISVTPRTENSLIVSFGGAGGSGAANSADVSTGAGEVGVGNIDFGPGSWVALTGVESLGQPKNQINTTAYTIRTNSNGFCSIAAVFAPTPQITSSQSIFTPQIRTGQGGF